MKRYLEALQDLLLILIGLGTIALVVSISSNSESGNTDIDSRVGTFLGINQPVPTASAIDASSITFSDIDGVEANELDADLEVATEEPEAEVDVTPEETPEASVAEEPADVVPEVEEAAPEPEVLPETMEESEPEENDKSANGRNMGPSTYTIKQGDTLGCIAETYYGSYEHWIDIAAVNTGEGYEEKRLFVGNELQLPVVDSLKAVSNASDCK